MVEGPVKMKFMDVKLKSPEMSINSGEPGSGKTVLSFSLADRLHKQTGKPVYVALTDKDKPIEDYKVPKYLHSFRGVLSEDSVPLDCVMLVDDLQRIAHARRTMSNANVFMDQMHALLRHNNVDFIYDTQTLAGIDRNHILRAKYRWYKQPYDKESELGRVQVKDEVLTADRELRGKGKTWAFLFTRDYKGLVSDIPLPGYWSEELSTLHRRDDSWQGRIAQQYRRII